MLVPALDAGRLVEAPPGIHTVLIRVDVFPRQVVLLVHLCLQVLLALVQHLELTSQLQYRALGGIFLCGGAATTEPAPHAVYECEGGAWDMTREKAREATRTKRGEPGVRESGRAAG